MEIMKLLARFSEKVNSSDVRSVFREMMKGPRQARHQSACKIEHIKYSPWPIPIQVLGASIKRSVRRLDFYEFALQMLPGDQRQRFHQRSH